MKTIAIVAQKGGVGKTTTAHAIGVGLAKYYSAKVLFVDTDAQGNLSKTMEADRNALTTLDVITGRAKAEDAIQHTPHGDIIASTPALSGAEHEPTLNKVGREYRLKKALETVSALYDYAVIDTPPALSILTVNALVAADKVVSPAQADIYSLDEMEPLQETIDTVKAYCNPNLQVDGILLTRFSNRAVISREIAELIKQATEGMSTRLYDTRIRECSALKEAQALNEDIYTYSPRSNAARDYKAVLDEIMRGDRNNG